MDDLVGRHVSELDTPMPVIDLDAMERNIARLATHARQRGIRQWPHTKTHKNPEIARMQLDAGAGGLTVAKPGEAEVMASHGLGPLLLHYPSFGAEKWRRIAGVAATTDLTVALDSAEAAEPLARELAARGVTAQALVELDVGMRRTGVDSPAAVLALAQTIDGLDGLEMAGLSCYPGHARGTDQEMRTALAAVEATLQETIGRLRDAGLRCDRVSAGSTPSMMLSELVPSMTEHRAGTYVSSTGRRSSATGSARRTARFACTPPSSRSATGGWCSTRGRRRCPTPPTSAPAARATARSPVIRRSPSSACPRSTACATSRPATGRGAWATGSR